MEALLEDKRLWFLWWVEEEWNLRIDIGRRSEYKKQVVNLGWEKQSQCSCGCRGHLGRNEDGGKGDGDTCERGEGRKMRENCVHQISLSEHSVKL